MSQYAEALKRLYSLAPLGRKLGLSRVQAVCDRLSNPERSFDAIHVAGTNGKGTVSAFLASMAAADSRKVGLYTSPHLVNYTERIRIDGTPIAQDKLAEFLTTVMDLGPDLTFFEVTTIAAFLAFREAKIDLAVLEVGLGGRLDATNVIPPPKAIAITRIAFDHMSELGDTLGDIAREKAGIIKRGSIVVLGKTHPEAIAVIEQRIAEVGARLVPLGSPEPISGKPLAYPRAAMLGSNLAVATTIARELGISTDAMCRGIEATAWPGRNELLHRNGRELTLLDCAHNPDGAVTLSHMLDPGLLGEIESRREIALVFGALKSKNWKAMLRRLQQVAGHRVYVAPPIPERAVPPEEMRAVLSGEVASSVAEALARARHLVGQYGVVVVSGSTYLVGAARALLLGLQPDPQIDL
ncbi:MAG: bifunctional folylpolyglutamate synthase/dihydrofolate synthase [Myxococcales bacterium]